MNLFKYFFTNKDYLPADLPGRLFSPLHICVMVVLFIAVPLLAFLLRKIDKKKMKIIFIVLWALATVLEVIKITWESLTNKGGFNPYGILPLYVCSIFMYAMPFAIWCKEGSVGRRAACGFLCTHGLIGGLVNFVYPSNILTNYSVISFAGLHTLFYHGTMVFVALLMLFSKYYTYNNLMNAIYSSIPLFATSIVANIVNFTLPHGAGYMFFRGDFPFTIIASHMPLWLWVITLYVLYFLLPFVFYLPALAISKLIKRKKRDDVDNVDKILKIIKKGL